MTIVLIVVSILVLVAAFLAIVTARAMWEAPDALTRLNLISPLTGVALPLLIVANVVYDTATTGFSALVLVRAILAIAFLLAVASVSGLALARSIYGTTVTDRVLASRQAHAASDRDDRARDGENERHEER